MSAHRLPQDLRTAAIIGAFNIDDPGDGGTINVNISHGVCPLTITGTSETRSLPDPTVGAKGIGIGTRLCVVANQVSGGGDCTIEGIVFTAEGQCQEFVVARVNGVLAWTNPTSNFILDLGGATDALILDDDGDTTISAPTDDQIDIELASADHVVLKAVAGADGGTTTSIAEIAFTSPVDTTGTNVHNGLAIDIEVGNSSGGTNSVVAIQVDGITGDAQVTETALNIGAGWERAIASAGATDWVMVANTAAALEFTDGTTSIAAFDTRNTVKNVANLTLTASNPTVASEAAAHTNSTLALAAKTITYTGTTGTTSSLGAGLHVGQPTWTDASMMTLTTASNVHISANAAAGSMLTITNTRMISTGVADCFLTNAGVWTDTACWESGKEFVSRAKESAVDAIDRVLDQIVPATWKYKAETALPAIDDEGNEYTLHSAINDRGRERVGIVYDDLPGELRAPGEERGVSPGVLASFALAAIKVLRDENRDLQNRLAAAGL